jgi:hypothetical protein
MSNEAILIDLLRFGRLTSGIGMQKGFGISYQSNIRKTLRLACKNLITRHRDFTCQCLALQIAVFTPVHQSSMTHLPPQNHQQASFFFPHYIFFDITKSPTT